MQVTFVCPDCQQGVRVEVPEAAAQFACPECGRRSVLSGEEGGRQRLAACPVCGCRELFLRANFPHRLGITIVVAGFLASSVAWYDHRWFVTLGILFATALADLVLYFTLGHLLECYRCHAQYRGVAGGDPHGPFQLETYERYRQQALRLAQAQPRAGRPGE